MNIAKWIIICTNIPIVITLWYALSIYNKLGEILKKFSWFIFVSAAIQLGSLFFWFLRKNNMPFLHVYVAIGFVCLAIFYNSILKDVLNPKIILTLTAFFLIYTLINSIFIQSVFSFNSYALAAESVLVIILALSTYLLFLNSMVKESRGSIINCLNWINSGLFIYYTSNLLLFYFGEIIMSQLPIILSRYIWVLHSFFSTVMYICFIVGLWKRPKELVS